MNGANLSVNEIFTRHKKLQDLDSIFLFLNKKHKITYHAVIMRHFLDAGIFILETCKPLVLRNIFGTNTSGRSYDLFYKFVEQGYFTKVSEGFILTDKGKIIMMEYMSLLRSAEKKYQTNNV